MDYCTRNAILKYLEGDSLSDEDVDKILGLPIEEVKYPVYRAVRVNNGIKEKSNKPFISSSLTMGGAISACTSFSNDFALHYDEIVCDKINNAKVIIPHSLLLELTEEARDYVRVRTENELEVIILNKDYKG